MALRGVGVPRAGRGLGARGLSIESISAITLVIRDMASSIAFYRSLGFELAYGGPQASFTSLRGGRGFVNLTTGDAPARIPFWGRVIFHVDDVDAVYADVRAAGYEPEARPRDASWGERYFHVRDPDGHELSIARPLLR